MILAAHGFDWNFVGGGAIVALTILSLGVALWRISPVGSATVQTLQDLLEAREAKIKSLEAALDDESETLARELKLRHDAELEVKDKETELAALNERPNTEQMLRTFETHHQENLGLLRESMANQQMMLDLAQKTLEGVGAIISREQSNQPNL